MFGVEAHREYTSIGGISLGQALNKVNADWYYDLGNSPRVYQGIEAVPMIWDETVVGKPIGGNSEWLMTFNEPDSKSQANMSLSDCARLYRRIELDYPNKKLVCPVPTADNPGWRWDFHATYTRYWGGPPRIDAVSAHIYPRTEEYFRKVMLEAELFAKRCGAKVWVTEYAFLPCWGTNAVSMMEYMTRYFMDRPNIFQRWAPFILGAWGTESWNFGPQCNPTLINMSTSKLTAVGEKYASMNERNYADPRADLTGDGKVDIGDIVLVASNFNKPASAFPKADINKDGVINILDLVFVAANFGKRVK